MPDLAQDILNARTTLPGCRRRRNVLEYEVQDDQI